MRAVGETAYGFFLEWKGYTVRIDKNVIRLLVMQCEEQPFLIV